MSVPRDHHFLPQFLLEPWCGADGKLTAYSKPYKDVVVTGRYAPSEVGKQADLYTYDGVPHGHAQVVETVFMQKVDSDAAQAFATVTAKGATKITSDDRAKLAVFILSMLARHPDSVAHAKAIGRKSLVAELDKAPEELIAAGLPTGKTFSALLAEKQPALLQNERWARGAPERHYRSVHCSSPVCVGVARCPVQSGGSRPCYF